MEKMAVQISKMVSSREKTTFQFLLEVFSWEKRAFQISMVFFHGEKGFLIFETDFRRSVFRLPWNKMKRFQRKSSPPKKKITQDLHMSASYKMVFIFFMFGPRLAKKHIQHGFVSRCGKSYDMLKLSYRFAFWNSGTCRMCRGNVVELPFVLQSESYI